VAGKLEQPRKQMRPASQPPADESAGMPKHKHIIDPDLIRQLAQLLEETGLTEIEFERDGERVRVARSLQPAAPVAVPMMPVPAATAQQGPVESGPADLTGHPGLVTSPMVGTAYTAPQPGGRPFVEIGSRVTAGQTLLIIEAMKTMNQIPAPRSGTVAQILVEDGQPVEFGEPLMIVD
jgi:acetyl-CoA carboxylase biotin carboxyl carrier protein